MLSPEYWSAISTLPSTIMMAPSNGAGPTCCGTSTTSAPATVPRQLYLPVGVNQFCRFTSLAWPRCWAALVR